MSFLRRPLGEDAWFSAINRSKQTLSPWADGTASRRRFHRDIACCRMKRKFDKTNRADTVGWKVRPASVAPLSKTTGLAENNFLHCYLSLIL